MKIGISAFPTDYSISAVALARAAEERGYDSLWVVEHTHIPASRRTPYPAGGDLPSIYWESYEPFTFLAQAAAVTESLLIGTGICLVPEHHPIALAKRVASIDSLSNGRFLFGVGAGWNAEELENHGVRYEERWKVLSESVRAMKLMWTEKAPEFHGDFVDFDPVWVEPKPKSKPHPPVYIGASSEWSVRRVAEFGDGWLPALGTCDLDERIGQLRRYCDDRGRDLSEIDISVFGGPLDKAGLESLARQGVRRLITVMPSEPESAVLKVLDQQAEMVEWASGLECRVGSNATS
jgi:probable F420-dependent oxidoreductase